MSKTVLICEDDEGIIDIATIVLKERGYNVVALTSSEEIFNKIEESQPDLILLDLWMPVLSGEEITNEIRKNPKTKHIPVVIVSANKDTKEIAEKIGATDSLAKPFDIADLENIVQKYIQK